LFKVSRRLPQPELLLGLRLLASRAFPLLPLVAAAAALLDAPTALKQ
jgi:hypothetical protein